MRPPENHVRRFPRRVDQPHWTQDPDQAGTFWRWCHDKKKLDQHKVLGILGVTRLSGWTPPQILARAAILLWISLQPRDPSKGDEP